MKIYFEFMEIMGCFLAYAYTLYALNIFCSYKKNRKPLAFVLGILYLPITYDRIFAIDNTAASLISMFVVFFVSIICFTGNVVTKMVIIFTYNLVSIIFSSVFYTIIADACGLSIDYLLSVRSVLRTIIIISLYLLEFLVLLLVKYIFLKRTIPKTSLSASEMALTGFLFAINFVYAFFSFCVIFYTPTLSFTLKVSCCAISLFCLVNAFITLYLTDTMRKKHFSDATNSFLQLEIEDYKKQFMALEENIKNTAKMHHDFKNQLLTYKIMLENKDYTILADKISEQLDSYNSIPGNTVTENIYFNALLNSKRQSACYHHIKFEMRIIMSANYQNIPLMIALSNLIDNAIEYEQGLPEKLRSINVTILQNEHSINISIRNYISASVLKNNPNLLSHKKNHHFHGYGIINAKNIIEKQHGLINFSEEDSYFYAQIFCSDASAEKSI
jgi:hypothetical protein